jgi:phage gp29-like protein
MGYQREQKEVEEFYNIKVNPVSSFSQDDFTANKTLLGSPKRLARFGAELIANKKPANKLLKAAKAEDELSYHIGSLDLVKHGELILQTAESLLKECDSYQEALNALAKAFATISFEEIEAALEKAYLNAAILGAAEIETEQNGG